MKKALLILSLTFTAYVMSAQCIVNPLQEPILVPVGDSLPCAVRGADFETYLYFNIQIDSTTPGLPPTLSISLDSLFFLSATGLPSGLQWELSPQQPYYVNGDRGCIKIFGNTTEAPDTFHLDFLLTVYLKIGGNSNPVQATISNFNFIPANTFETTPVLRVIEQGAYCPTSIATHNVNYIRGRVYHDINNNGIYDSLDLALQNQLIQITPGGRLSVTNRNGEYLMGTTQGSYTLIVLSDNGYETSNPAPLNVSLLNIIDSAVNQDFPMYIVDTLIDMEVTVTSLPARPGFSHHQYILLNNIGNIYTSSQVSLLYDTALTFVSSNVTPDTHIGNELRWTIPTIAPQQQQQFHLVYDLPPDINLMGDTLTSVAAVTTSLTDDNLSNNTYTEKTVVTAAYDPNDKTPYPTEKLDEAFIDSGEPLMYRIRFQNTGTDTAFNITVRDTLDLDKFEVETIRLIGASHEYTFRIEQGNIAIWEFPNILLPDSNINEPLSHGFILFELDLIPGLGHGDVVENRAGIYFDFNPVVLTDYAISNVDFSTGIGKVSRVNHISVYPNPVQDRLVILHSAWQQGSDFQLMDLSGKIILNQPLTATRTELNTNNLPNGMYLYRVVGANGTEGMGKVVVAK